MAGAIGEGCLSYEKGHRAPRFRYVSSDAAARRKMIQLCDVVGDVACHEDKEGRLTLSSSIVAYLLHKAGLPMGRKTVTNPGVPYWLTRSERTIRARYLKRVFSDEGEFIGTEGRSAPYGVSMSATYYIPMPRGSNPSRLKAKQRTATRESASRRGSLRGSYRMSLASPSGGTEIAGIRGCHAGRLWHQGKAAPQGDLQEAGWGHHRRLCGNDHGPGEPEEIPWQDRFRELQEEEELGGPSSISPWATA